MAYECLVSWEQKLYYESKVVTLYAPGTEEWWDEVVCSGAMYDGNPECVKADDIDEVTFANERIVE